jgi:mannosyltransferase
MKTKPIRVIYNGFDDKTFYPSIDNVTKRQVLFVGARSKRKNFHKVIELMKLLPEINLVIVGSRLSSNDKKLIKSIKNKVIVKENIKSSELRTIYSESICLLYMSEYEGFGLPVIEAMASGCPVLAMNKSSIPEISSDAGILFDSFDLDLISTEVFKLLDDKLYRESIITKSLINSKRFSWSKSISEHLQFYNQLTFNNSNINL